MRTSAKVDYAVRAAMALASVQPLDGSRAQPMKGAEVAVAQDLPMKFLESILAELKRGGLIGSQRGADGGYWLARPAADISVADVIRAVEGPLADVRGVRPDALGYDGDLEVLQRMWVAVRANLRAVLENVSLADLRTGSLPAEIEALVAVDEAWVSR